MSASATKANSKPTTFLVTVGAAGIAAAYSWFVFLPSLKATQKLRQETVAKEQAIMRGETVVHTVVANQEQLRQVEERIAKWKSASPRDDSLHTIFARISRDARDAGVALPRFEPQPAIDLESLRQYQVVLSASGNLPQLFDFLKRIEQLPQTVWFSNLQIIAPRGENEPVTCEMTLTIFGDRAANSDQSKRG